MVGAAAMDAMKDKTLAQGELLGLHTQNPDDGANVKQRIMTTLQCRTDWPKDKEASYEVASLSFHRVTNRARTNASLSQFKQMKNSLWIHLKRLRKY